MDETTNEPYVLLIDDDAELCDLVSQYLTGRGFHVDIEGDGEVGLARAKSGQYELLILDVMLPGMNGFEVLRQLRTGATARLPVVMLTAHGDEIDRIVGLELGADDYLPKPFNPRELLARIRAVLRRAAEMPRAMVEPSLPSSNEPAAASTATDGRSAEPMSNQAPPPRIDSVTVGDMTMDMGARSLRCAGEIVELTATEFDLMSVLMQKAGRVVSRDDLAREGMGRRLLPFDRSLDLHMSKLRRKLGPKPNGGERIKTLRSVGYLLDKDEKPA